MISLVINLGSALNKNHDRSGGVVAKKMMIFYTLQLLTDPISHMAMAPMGATTTIIAHFELSGCVTLSITPSASHPASLAAGCVPRYPSTVQPTS
jgi:hypothetical protein